MNKCTLFFVCTFASSSLFCMDQNDFDDLDDFTEVVSDQENDQEKLNCPPIIFGENVAHKAAHNLIECTVDTAAIITFEFLLAEKDYEGNSPLHIAILRAAALENTALSLLNEEDKNASAMAIAQYHDFIREILNTKSGFKSLFQQNRYKYTPFDFSQETTSIRALIAEVMKKTGSITPQHQIISTHPAEHESKRRKLEDNDNNKKN